MEYKDLFICKAITMVADGLAALVTGGYPSQKARNAIVLPSHIMILLPTNFP